MRSASIKIRLAVPLDGYPTDRTLARLADDFIVRRPGVHGRSTPPGCQLRDTTAFLTTFVDCAAARLGGTPQVPFLAARFSAPARVRMVFEAR